MQNATCRKKKNSILKTYRDLLPGPVLVSAGKDNNPDERKLVFEVQIIANHAITNFQASQKFVSRFAVSDRVCRVMGLDLR